MVSDSGGFDDKSFNQTSHDGPRPTPPSSSASRPPRSSPTATRSTPTTSTQLVDEGCNEITTVGFLLGDATLAAAKTNPDVDFAIVDFAFTRRQRHRPRTSRA